MSEYDPIIGIPIGGYRKEGAAMSDDELLQSLDTYACQLREANAKLIYAAKARIEALRGEVDLIKTLGVGAALETVAQKERAQKAEAEAARLKGALVNIKALGFGAPTYKLGRNIRKAVEIARKALAGETTSQAAGGEG